jgi:hypothetical protein
MLKELKDQSKRRPVAAGNGGAARG